MANFDAIVIGLGGMGSAVLFELARRGLRVLGVEQFSIAHDRGSSHGETRIIRKSYFEHPDYVPLVGEAFRGWAELESRSGVRLFQRTGLLLAGSSDAPSIQGVRRAADKHWFELESLSVPEAARRFTPFRFDEGWNVLFEPGAGFLHVERCVQTYVEQAQTLGATVLTGRRIRRWSAENHAVAVEDDQERWQASALVICAGPWAVELLKIEDVPLVVRRKVMLWFETRDRRFQLDHGCPMFGFDLAGCFFYGFPSLDGRLVKAAEHTGGESGIDADDVDRGFRCTDSERVCDFVRTRLPSVAAEVARHSVCMYTMTPDEHFIVDRSQSFPNVVYATGFSGHGFKFAPVMGRMLADMVVDSGVSSPVDLFRAKRF